MQLCVIVIFVLAAYEDQDNGAVEPYPEDLAQEFTEMFVKQADNVTLLLSLLQVGISVCGFCF